MFELFLGGFQGKIEADFQAKAQRKIISIESGPCRRPRLLRDSLGAHPVFPGDNGPGHHKRLLVARCEMAEKLYPMNSENLQFNLF